MRAFIFSVFLCITQVLSREIRFSRFANIETDFITENQKNIASYHKKSYESNSLRPNLLIKRDKDFTEFVERFEKLIFIKPYFNDNRDKGYKKLRLNEKDKAFKTIDSALGDIFIDYFKEGISLNSCINLTSSVCPILQSRQHTEEEAASLDHLCSDKDGICKKILKYMEKICIHVKTEQEAITNFTSELCNEHMEKCDDLDVKCEDILKNTCQKVREECEVVRDPACKKQPEIPEKHEPDPLTTISADIYTGTGTIVEHVTITVTVDAEETCTRFETETETVTRCSCGCHDKSCTITGTEHLPTPDSNPEPEPAPEPTEPEPAPEPTELEPGPEPTEPKPDSNSTEPEPGPEPTEPESGPEPTEPESGPEPTEPKPDSNSTEPEPGSEQTEPEPGSEQTEPEPGSEQTEPEPGPEPSQPNETEETCKTISTLTVTVDPTEVAGGDETNKACNEAYGMQIKGFYREKILMVLGIIAGICLMV